jgi:hypothetical protein
MRAGAWALPDLSEEEVEANVAPRDVPDDVVHDPEHGHRHDAVPAEDHQLAGADDNRWGATKNAERGSVPPSAARVWNDASTPATVAIASHTRRWR